MVGDDDDKEEHGPSSSLGYDNMYHRLYNRIPLGYPIHIAIIKVFHVHPSTLCDVISLLLLILLY